MAEEESGEKQHQATGKRLSDLRAKGTVLRSKDLSSGLMLILAILQIIYLSSEFQVKFQKNLLLSLNGIKNILSNKDILSEVLRSISINSLLILIPIFIVPFLAAWLAPFVFGGWNFTLEALHFKGENINPIRNLKNIFSIKRAASEILKSVVKSTLMIGILVYYGYVKRVEILSLTGYPVLVAVHRGFSIILTFIMLLCAAIVLMAIMDMIIQYFLYQSQTKMSAQEVKEEHKEMDGSAEVKRKMRGKQIALMKQRLQIMVPQATVIITNPTHYAVALRYDENKDKAPKVLAKGKDLIAQQIRQLAISNGIPIYEAPLLARAIFHTTKSGLDIRPELYMSVAIVLSYVHQLKNYQLGRGKLPNITTDLKIPAEFIYTE